MRRDLDILPNREVGYQIIELEHEAKLASAIFAKRLLAEARDSSAAYFDSAPISRFKAADKVQKRRFARTRGAEQHANLAARDFHVDAAQHFHTRCTFAIAFHKAARCQIGRARIRMRGALIQCASRRCGRARNSMRHKSTFLTVSLR